MLISYIRRCTWEFRNSGKRCGCVATPPLVFRNSGNYGNYGKRCGCVATPPVEFRNSGNYGKRCGCVANPCIFRNSTSYGNFVKRCYITGPSGIPEFRELWEFREEMSYHWALWNSGIPGILGIDVILLGSLEFWNFRKF